MTDYETLLATFNRLGVQIYSPNDAERMFMNSPTSESGKQICIQASDDTASVFFFGHDGKYCGHGILKSNSMGGNSFVGFTDPSLFENGMIL